MGESGAIITAGCSNKQLASAENSPCLQTDEVNLREKEQVGPQTAPVLPRQNDREMMHRRNISGASLFNVLPLTSVPQQTLHLYSGAGLCLRPEPMTELTGGRHRTKADIGSTS